MLKRSLAALLSILFVSACQDEGPPPEPAAVEAVSATVLPAAPVGSLVATVPTFRAVSATGKSVGGLPVTVTVLSGGGSIARPATKTRGGPTNVGRWTLGPTAGPQSISVRVSPFAPIIYTVNATAGAAVAMQKLAGDNSRGPALFTLPAQISVKVVDNFGNGVPAATVAWSVQAGGGSVAAPTSVTDSIGVAVAPEWTLGTQSSGAQRLRATSGTFTQEFNATLQSAAASITLETPAPTSFAAGTTIPSAPTFAVRDADGNILNSIPFTISVTAGGGVVTGTVARTLVGPTPIGSWKLGNPLGTQTVQVSVAGIPSLFISTTSIVGPATQVTVIEGADQRALAGTPLGAPLRVRVRDVANHNVANATVTWEVVGGGGTVGGLTSTTNGEGVTTMPAWTLGKLGGAQTIRASVGPVSQNIAAEIQTDFNLQVRWSGTPPGGPVEVAFTNAVNRIRAIIVGTVPSISVSGFTSSCAPGVTLNETITGLVIYATVEFIDGPGSVLGSAGPCSLRSSDQLSWLGRMRFDSADLDNMVTNGTLEAVILHEMLHVIGVGTIWTTKGLRSGTAPTTTPFFTGPLARAACIDQHAGASVCGGGVPVEDCVGIAGCGSGTINSHWKELTFRTELMTGYVSGAGVPNPFSRMTIQSLADMGYVVNISAEDPYTVPPPALMSPFSAFTIKMPEPHGPLDERDSSGRVTRRFMTNLPPLDR